MKWMTEQSLKALEFLKVMGKLIPPHSQDQCSAPLCYTKGHIEAILQGTIQYAPSHQAPLPQPAHLCQCPGGRKQGHKQGIRTTSPTEGQCKPLAGKSQPCPSLPQRPPPDPPWPPGSLEPSGMGGAQFGQPLALVAA